MAAMTCGQALVRLLEEHGIDTVFGIPGVHTLELYRGLAGSGIRHILVRHEQGAGFMADGYARASGRPAACFVITGPGLTNIATPMGQAYSDSVPMLVISTVNERKYLGKGEGRLHEITDQAAVSRPLTGFQGTAGTPGEVGDLVNDALAGFKTNRPRPAHIEIPLDIMNTTVQAPFEKRSGQPPVKADEALLRKAVDRLASSGSPVILAGGGARHATKALMALSEKFAAPVITTIAGKGAVPDSFPFSLSSTLACAETFELLRKADTVLMAGTEFAETDYWRDDPGLDGDTIRIDIDPAKLNAPVEAWLAIEGDAGDALARMVELAAAHAPSSRHNDLTGKISEHRQAIEASRSPLQEQHVRVLNALEEALPPEAIFATDMTQIAYTGNVFLGCEIPDRWLHPTGFGTLGYAMPAAVGAKLAKPDTPVVAISGDAGFLFTMQDLATAAELELGLPIILWNNNALGQIRDDMVRSDIPEIGVVGRNPDFRKLAEAFGCGFVRPASIKELQTGVAEALERTRPTVIEVMQDADWLTA